MIEPKVMLGTVVLLVETPARPDIDICLRLRTSAKPIRVGRSHVGDFVLGTDFTYEDLRFWLPSDDFAVFGISHCVQDGREAWVLDVKRHSDRRKGSTMRIRVDASLFAPRKIEWFSSEVSVADKIYEAKMFRLIDAVWCPTVMTVSRPGDGYLSIMTLQHASHGLHLDDDLFTCEYLPRFDAQALMKVARGPSE